MTSFDRFDRDFAAWLDAETSLSAPAELHAVAMDQARRTTQRPAWVVALRGGTIAAPGLAVPNRRTLSLLVVLGLLVVAGLAVIGLGALRTKPQPLGANGLIAYSYQGRNHGPGGTLLVGPDGSGSRPSPVNGCVQFSQDGRFLVVADDDGPRSTVRLVDTVTGVERLVPTPNLDFMWHPHPGSFALSPDGTRVAWLKDTEPAFEGPHRLELWVSVVGEGSAKLVVPAPAGRFERFAIPAWSPDSRSLAFESYTTDAPTGRDVRSAISVVDAKTRVVRVISGRSGLVEPGLAWSLDGGSIVYAGLPDGVPLAPDRDGDPPELRSPSDLFIIAKDGTGERKLTSSTASEHQPAWAPDGTRLAYLTSTGADVDVEARLTTLAMDGTTPTGTAALGPPAEFVIWSPDSMQLLAMSGGPVGTGTGTLVRTIDRDLTRSSSPIAAAAGSVNCPPSWQRLDP